MTSVELEDIVKHQRVVIQAQQDRIRELVEAVKEVLADGGDEVIRTRARRLIGASLGRKKLRR